MISKVFSQFILLFSVTLLLAGEIFAEGLRDVKPPLAYPLSIIFLAAFFCLLLLALILVWLLFKRRRREVMPTQQLSPWENAVAQLRELEKQGLVAAGQWDRYYSQLTDILRNYIEEQLSIRAPEMTTEEFLQHLQRSAQLNPAQKASLRSFLESSDLVKFAKYAPDPSEAKKSFDLAVQFIQETKPKEEHPV